jgi:hypothetical protein
MELDVDEFLRRFLLHIVPDGFVRIRHFGLFANEETRHRASAGPWAAAMTRARSRGRRGGRPAPP